VQTFTVTCELKKKATAGGFKWNTPPPVGSFQLIDTGPIGNGFRVRLYVLEPTAANQGLTVTSNCVKSRLQRGTPPS
jgi:hypothetical protein